MSAKRIIPCLDVDGGRVVKGIHFVNLVDAGDPVENAQQYCRQGADELVFLDITASTDSRATVVDLVERIRKAVSVPLAVGGGIRSVEDVQRLVDAGADKVSINSAAVRNPQLLSEAARRFGAPCTVAAIDARRAPRGYEVCIDGGRTSTGMDVIGWARNVEALGAGEILLTSVDRDGTEHGYDVALTREVSEAVDIPVIASGGAGKPAHIYEVLVAGRASAALAASIFHFGHYSIQQVKDYLRERGVMTQGVQR